MIELTLIPLLGILGPLQGGAIRLKRLKFIYRVLIGLCFGFLFWQVGPWFSLYGLIACAACFPGVGQSEGQAIDAHMIGAEAIYPLYEPTGSRGGLETWQKWLGPVGEWLRHRPYWGLVARDTMFLNPAFMLASPLAMVIGLRLPHIWHMDENRWHECLHYSLAYFFTWVLLFALGII